MSKGANDSSIKYGDKKLTFNHFGSSLRSLILICGGETRGVGGRK